MFSFCCVVSVFNKIAAYVRWVNTNGLTYSVRVTCLSVTLATICYHHPNIILIHSSGGSVDFIDLKRRGRKCLSTPKSLR
jgi:hypothetical protein